MAKIKQYGLTPWGRGFYESLVALYEDEGRLARGKTYFNKGFVYSLVIKGSIVHAKVKGSIGSLYSVSIEFEPFEKKVKKDLIATIKKDP